MLVPTDTPIYSDATSYPFTQRELVRLAAYRAAVKAGFYNESAAVPDFPDPLGAGTQDSGKILT
jgi:hypothetical protein